MKNKRVLNIIIILFMSIFFIIIIALGLGWSPDKPLEVMKVLPDTNNLQSVPNFMISFYN